MMSFLPANVLLCDLVSPALLGWGNAQACCSRRKLHCASLEAGAVSLMCIKELCAEIL